MKRENKDVGYVSIYEFDDAAAKATLDIREFAQADVQWLRFVVNNRRGTQDLPQADIDIGPVADDNVYASIRLFETNVLDEDETIKRLKTETLHDQITFHTDAALAFCKLIGVREIRRRHNMEKAKFSAILPFICADLANMISLKENISEEEAISSLYASDLYAQLEKEETKLWQYSTPMLYQIFQKSIETGKIQYPDI